MTNLRYQRRLAASLLKCGVNRVRIANDYQQDQEKVEEAITRADLRNLIKWGVITKRPENGISRARHRHHLAQREKGRRRGHGSRKGAGGARTPRKQTWMNRIRAQRKLLVQLRDDEVLERSKYRLYYRRAKGGMYHSRAHMLSHLRGEGAIPADYEPPTPAQLASAATAPDGGEA